MELICEVWEEVEIIHVSDEFPGGVWNVRENIPEDLKKDIQEAFLNVPEGHDILESFDFVKFVEVEDSQYDGVREAARLIDLEIGTRVKCFLMAYLLMVQITCTWSEKKYLFLMADIRPFYFTGYRGLPITRYYQPV